MNAFRNLYKIRNARRAVVGYVTACGEVDALMKYRAAGGDEDQAWPEQISTGYPSDVLTVYA